MGTTVATILINEDSAVIAHAGDTRIYQLRKGAIIFRSSDHSVVANLVRQKKITEEEARNHPQSNIVTRALGIRPSMEIEFDEVTFLRGDRFVLCTDGIWGMMPQRDLVKSLSYVMGISELTSTIVEEIDRIGHSNGGGHDNLTLAIVDTSFDSSLKKIKKNPKIVNQEENRDKESIVSSKNKHILLLVAGLVTTILIIILYFILSHENSVESEGQGPLKGITTTTISYEKVKIKYSDSINPDSQSIDEQVISSTQSVIGNPFQDSTLINEQRQEVARQINHVVKDLDSLKKINEKSKGNTEKKKKAFVKEVIKPDMNRLGNNVANGKKKDVEEILRLLNDKNTVSCYGNGQATRNSKKHIEIIKTKVRGLQN